VEKSQYELLIEILRRFDQKKLLKTFIVIGSWCLPLYEDYFKRKNYLSGLTLRTRDVDFLVSKPSQIKEKVDIPELLRDLGFVTIFKGHQGYLKVVVISFDGKYAYVTNSWDDTISIINLATNLKLGSDVDVGDLPKDLAVRPGNEHVYVVNNLDGAVSLVEIFVPTYNVTDPRDPEFDYLQVTYTYYDDLWGNQMESKTLAVADDGGNIYYHYEKDTGWNLMDVSQRLIANSEGEIAFEYRYYTGFDVIQFKDSFTDIDRQNPYATYEYDVDENLIGVTYYQASQAATNYVAGSIDADELMSKQEAQRKNRYDFTGYFPKVNVPLTI